MSELRVRFPPSPTGYLHIGSARTALYNWLLARKAGGRLVLRIEDTDTARSTEESTRAILEGLEWMGIDWDEGPYNQTEHTAEHRAAAERLVESGHAYRCYCAREELEARREVAKAEKRAFIGYDGTCRHLSAEERAAREAEGRSWVIRVRVPQEPDTIVYEDVVYGKNEIRADTIEDFVVVRSNGEPLYVLSNVVDDHRDRISLVVRGADHRLNTIKQVLLYQALGWPVPDFGHIPLTLDPQKAKISKRRHGEVVTVDFYRERGFLPSAFCNFVALQGWNPGDDREVFIERAELIEAFDLAKVGRSNSVFNYRKGDPRFITDPKALHINAQHIRAVPLEELGQHLRPFFEAEGLWDASWEGGEGRAEWLATLDLLRPRMFLLTDFLSLGRAYFADDYGFDKKAVKRSLRREERLVEWLPLLADALGGLDTWTLESTEGAIRGFAEGLDVSAGVIINAVRVAVTGQGKGPGLFDVLVALGQARTVARLRDVFTRLEGA